MNTFIRIVYHDDNFDSTVEPSLEEFAAEFLYYAKNYDISNVAELELVNDDTYDVITTYSTSEWMNAIPPHILTTYEQICDDLQSISESKSQLQELYKDNNTMYINIIAHIEQLATHYKYCTSRLEQEYLYVLNAHIAKKQELYHKLSLFYDVSKKDFNDMFSNYTVTELIQELQELTN